MDDRFVDAALQSGEIHKIIDLVYEEIPKNLDNLRNFHNTIKMGLIFDAKNMTGGEKLLDVAVGRGGDIGKWSRAKFKYVTAFDSDKKSIYEKTDFDGAIQRYKDIQGKMFVPKCFFWNISATDRCVTEKINGKDRGTIYDVVSCQFALHYFVKELDTLLDMVSKKLKKDGIFIGTASNGNVIKKNISHKDINIPFLSILKKDNDSYEYDLKVNSSNGRGTYFEYRGALSEYYLDTDLLIEKCKKYSLELVRMETFHEWKLRNKNTIQLSLCEKIISYMNFTFVFRKVY